MQEQICKCTPGYRYRGDDRYFTFYYLIGYSESSNQPYPAVAKEEHKPPATATSSGRQKFVRGHRRHHQRGETKPAHGVPEAKSTYSPFRGCYGKLGLYSLVAADLRKQ